MGRRKKKKVFLPYSLWTPIVQGLNTDASDSGAETADLESSHPMEPIEEHDEAISGDDSGSSSNGEAHSSEASIDDAIAANDDVSSDFAPNSGISLLPETLGFPEPQIELQTVREVQQLNLQVNPKTAKHSSDSSFNFGDDRALDSNVKFVSFKRIHHLAAHRKDIWKPIARRKQSVWQRVSTQSKSTHQTPNLTDPPLMPAPLSNDDLRLHNSSSSTNQMLTDKDTCLPETSSRGQPSVQPDPDLPQQIPSCSNQPEPDSDKNEFQKVQKRRRKKSSGLATNPEHHQDKPKAMASP
ncbi:hypothetical protein Dimus_037057 [Dionaea muscipula]